MQGQPELWAEVRESIIGKDAVIHTPFGQRRLTYADYTASGRAVRLVEERLQSYLDRYGNTHTEDDATGMLTSRWLKDAEATIKRLVNAGPAHKIVTVGSGTTAAVHRLQQILGIYVPPAGRDFFRALLADQLPADQNAALAARLDASRPVVFVGPYEHHSNEVSWRECYAEVVEIDLTPEGLLDLGDLRRKVSSPAYASRRRIGAFSAASNVSGVTTPVYEVARILHEHGALAFFDYAASAPYVPMDMRHDEQSGFDALYFSPHKFLGGPGSCGVLIFHERIYRADLSPTVSAGGTVDYVGFDGQAYSTDIEVREKAGTPPILQTMRAALAMELKERLGQDLIRDREEELTRRAHAELGSHPAIQLMGAVGPEKRLPIFSFNIRVGSSWLHPRFVTTLLNDLFGIQSRAGCSCAGPYGHRLLHIDAQKSDEFRRAILRGNVGLKPGWARVNFHYLHTDAEAAFICRAIRFVADHGTQFLPRYEFDLHSGAWRHRGFDLAEPAFGLGEGFGQGPGQEMTPAATPASAAPAARSTDADLERLFEQYFAEARRLVESMGRGVTDAELKTTEKDLIPFVYI